MTAQEAANQMRGIVEALAREVNNAEIAALNSGLGEYLGRIFNDGKATDLSSLGGYSDEHARKRRTPRGSVPQKPIKTGSRQGQLRPSDKTLNTYPLSALQTNYKDLQFFGDLFNGIIIGTSQGVNVMGFSRSADKLKVQGTEDYIGKDVIPLSTPEKDIIDKVYLSRINEIIKQA
jgi:hypothetical protein